MSSRLFGFTILLALPLATLAACGREAAPGEAAAASAAPTRPPAPSANPAPPGTRAHACPGIEELDAAPRRPGPCTEMGCMDGFSITLFPTASWPPGNYRFVIKQDGTTTTCEGRLPLKPCEEDSIVCDGKAAGVGASGCALPPDQQAFGNIGFEGYPAVVDIDVLRDDVLLTHAHYDVAYQMQEANGPGCGPVCCSAPQGALTLPKAN